MGHPAEGTQSIIQSDHNYTEISEDVCILIPLPEQISATVKMYDHRQT
jgi:hypothetical protein